MAPRTLAGLSTVLVTARTVPLALHALSQDVSELDRNASVALFLYDGRREVLGGRIFPTGDDTRPMAAEVALDHLPAAARRTVLAGRDLADLGSESGDYQKLLGTNSSPDAPILLLRGLLVDAELAAVLALSEPKTRFGQRLSEKMAPAIDLFSLAFARIAEHDARIEAVARLEELTRALNEEHSRALLELQRDLEEARAALSGRGDGDSPRVAQLQRAAELAAVESRAMTQRVSAVEEQVRVAVTKLEKAHLQLHAQGEALQQQSNLIYRVEQRLRGAGDPAKVIEEVLEAVTSRAEHVPAL